MVFMVSNSFFEIACWSFCALAKFRRMRTRRDG